MAENKASDVREAQRYLRTISKYNPNIPMTVADGTYSDDTRDAVAAFQRERGLPETGEIDPRTWDELYKLYKEAALFFAELESIVRSAKLRSQKARQAIQSISFR